MQELYISFDVETDGPTPCVNNLLSIGMVGITKSLQKVFTFYANITPLDGHISNADTMIFWNKPENINACKKLFDNQKDYYDIFNNLSTQLDTLSGQYKLHFVAMPASFDWMWLKCYYEMTNEYNKKNQLSSLYQIGYKCLCLSTVSTIYKSLHKMSSNGFDKMIKEFGEFKPELEHDALDDARYQGIVYIKLIDMINK